MRRGFTLVELSIVLVIIGLLIGGILVAQSMIDTAKISGQVKQIQQFDAAVINFKTKYNGLPGDSSKMNGIGNNNGILDHEEVSPGPFPYVTIFSAPPHPEHGPQGVGGNLYNGITGERAEFWKDLYLSGLKIEGMSSAPDNDTSGGIRYNQHIPQAAIGKSGVFPTRVTSFFSSGTDSNTYVITDNTGVSLPGISYQSGAFTTSQVIAIDNKMDDGGQTTGNVVSLTNQMSGGACMAYLIGDNARNCNLFIRMIAQAE